MTDTDIGRPDADVYWPPEPADVKLCRDCRWCYRGEIFTAEYANARCAKSVRINLVTGESYRELCASMRDPWRDCGPEAKLFEARQG